MLTIQSNWKKIERHVCTCLNKIHTQEFLLKDKSRAAKMVKTPGSRPGDLSLFLESTCWNERTNSLKLLSDLHMCQGMYMNTHKTNKHMLKKSAGC